MLELETKIFEEKLPQLLKTDNGKFVLIKNENVIGTFVTIKDALRAGYQKFPNDAFFVRQISEIPHTLNLASQILLV